MIEIKNQNEFDEKLCKKVPTDEMVVIYPLEDGKPYILKSPLKIPSHTYIKGVRKPTIQCGFSEGDYMLGFVGESGSKLESIRIEGLVLDGNKIPKSIISVEHCGTETTIGSTIRDCILSNTEDSSWGVICIRHSSRNIITGNTISDNKNYGIVLNSSSNNTITGNNIINNDTGIYLNNSSNNTITGNNISNNKNYGICLAGSSNNTVMGNIISNNKNQGIYLINSSSSNTITGNAVNNNGNGGIYLTNSSNNNTVTGNTINSNVSYGVYLSNSANNNTITGNTVSNNKNYGIFLTGSSDLNTVTGNIINSNQADGIYVLSLNSKRCVIMSNQLVGNNGKGLNSEEQCGIIVLNNIAKDNKGGNTQIASSLNPTSDVNIF